jgi:formylglycine-generating enzyme required for sulfatase activity
MIRSLLLIFFFSLLAASLNAQTEGSVSRYALVIGNGNYTELGKLKNPANDATDMAATLKDLGFKVELLVDADLPEMEDAVIRLGNDLSQSADSTGFFFYAGHGVQSGGVNYLIPADARIASEAFLKTKALAAQSVLDTLQGARNALNVVVLDACRDNPFSWSRSGNRGLGVVGSQPPGSIVAYATSAGSVALDGTGRNGMFTQELLKQLKTPGLEIKDVFNRTGKAVSSATAGKQVPAVYNQFFDNAYLAGAASAASSALVTPAKAPSFGTVQAATGSLTVSLATGGTLSVGGISAQVPAGTVPVNDLPACSTTVIVRYADGKTESYTATVPAGGMANVAFSYVPAASAEPIQATVITADKPFTNSIGMSFLPVAGGSFQMGGDDAGSLIKPVHTVTLTGFHMAATEVTQKQWLAVMGNNPSDFKGDNLPVQDVRWYDAVEFCNKLSAREGLSPAYSISGTTISWNKGASGYRLPTEAEWEYAAKGGTKSRGYTYPGGNDAGSVGWYEDNSGGKTHEVGQKKANELGLYDMNGNVWEWCWDWFGDYQSGNQTDPQGASSGTERVMRGAGFDFLRANWDPRSVMRSYFSPGYGLGDLGFRVVRPLAR